VRSGRIRSAALLAITITIGIVAGCASSAPHRFGQYNDLAPKVAATPGERAPNHVTVQLGRPANVTVFLVIPGRGSELLFPSDSLESGFVEAGSHLVATSRTRGLATDSSRLRRVPPDQAAGNRGQQGGRGAGGRGGSTALGFNTHGYLLIYASQAPLPYDVLSSKVSGLSIPISDDDALNTVTKLIRESTHTSGPWAAYATDYPP
jgi:hypothetical protein